jgi:hypothetical protein
VWRSSAPTRNETTISDVCALAQSNVCNAELINEHEGKRWIENDKEIVWKILYRAYFFFIIILSAVGLSPLGTASTTGLLHQPQMIDDDDDCGAIGGMEIGR